MAMKLKDEIRDLLPEYLKELLPKELKKDIELHLKECKDCQDELSLLSGLLKTRVSFPNEGFFNTLPQRIMASLDEIKEPFFVRLWAKLFRPLPVAVAFASLFLAIFLFFQYKENEPSLVGNGLYLEDFTGYSYYHKLAFLEEKELNSLYEAIN
ncbi:MAG: zf-HC2 domain-containing protein [bacterium]